MFGGGLGGACSGGIGFGCRGGGGMGGISPRLPGLGTCPASI